MHDLEWFIGYNSQISLNFYLMLNQICCDDLAHLVVQCSVQSQGSTSRLKKKRKT